MQDSQGMQKNLSEEITSLKQRIAELEQSEKEVLHLASFPKLTPVMIFEVNKNKQVIFCNPAMQSVLDNMGIEDPCVFIPEDIWQLFGSSDIDANRAFIREVFVRNSLFVEHIFFTPQFNSLRVYANDSTKQNMIENRLKARDDMFNSFFDAVHETMILIDTEGKVILSNKVVAERLGKTVSELEGACIYDCFPPDVAAFRKLHYDHVIETGNPVHFEDIRLGRSFEQYCYPVFDKDKKVSGVTIFARETTNQKQAQEALIAEKNLSDSILDSTPGIFYCFDDQFRYKRWNKNLELVTGYSAEEITKISPLDLFGKGDREVVGEAVRKVFAEGETSGVEADIVSKDGRIIPYFFTGRKVVIDNADCLIGMGVDITERKLLE